jgi:hypothetical protein
MLVDSNPNVEMALDSQVPGVTKTECKHEI